MIIDDSLAFESVKEDIASEVESMKHDQLWEYVEKHFPGKYKSAKEFLRIKLVDEIYNHKLDNLPDVH